MPNVPRRAVVRGAGFLFLPAVVTGCSRSAVLSAVAPDDGVVCDAALAYGPGPRHRLDLYRPADRKGESLPTVLFVYGGSWEEGSREQYRFAGVALAQEGFQVAVADYRLYPEVRFPQFVEDAAKAAVWLGSRADGPLHLVGHSAGAHIAAMLAYDRRYLEAEGASAAMLGRFVGLAGPYAFHPFKLPNVRDVFAGLSDENAARPISFVNAASPPSLLLHGAADRTVAPRESQALAHALEKAGVKAGSCIFPDVDHVELVLSLSLPYRHLAPTLADTARFIADGSLPPA